MPCRWSATRPASRWPHTFGAEPSIPPRGPSTRSTRRRTTGPRSTRARLPGLEPARLGPETCLYTMTGDEDFVLDREGPAVVGAGCSGHAFKFGPMLGEMLADLALGK